MKQDNIERIAGTMLILNERMEQIDKHGKTAHYDDMFNNHGELLIAAQFCISQDRNYYPRNWDVNDMVKIEKKSHKERLIVAGALLAAEIDTITRKELADKEKLETYEH